MQEYRSISNCKPTSLTTIGWSIESTCGSEDRARYNEIMTKYCPYVFLCCKILKHKNKIISNTKISDMNQTVIIIFVRYPIYLLICSAIFSEWRWFYATWIIINPNTRSWYRYIGCFIFYSFGENKNKINASNNYK